MSRFPRAQAQGVGTNPRRERFAAFTFIELLIVMVVVGIVGAIALPRYGRAVSHYRLTGALNRVVADINAARSSAMATSKNQTITFNAGANTYTITGLASLENNGSAYTANLSAEPYKTAISVVSFGASLQTVTFDSYGTPDNAGSISLACGSVVKSVAVDATGKVTLP